MKVLFLTIYSAVGHSDRHGGAHARQGGPRAPDAVRLRQARSAINTGTGTRLHEMESKRITYVSMGLIQTWQWQITGSPKIRWKSKVLASRTDLRKRRKLK